MNDNDLTGQHISITYPRLLQTVNNLFYDGIGNTVSIGAGSMGPQGPQGSGSGSGTEGPQGYQGPRGDLGLYGPQGYQGPQGPQGSNGTIGVQGFQGFEGSQGFQGFDGPQGFQGFDGIGLTPLVFSGNVNVQTNPTLNIGDEQNFGYKATTEPWAEGQYVTFSDQNSNVVYTGLLRFQSAGGFGIAFGLSSITQVSGSSSNAGSSDWTMAFAAAPIGPQGFKGAQGANGVSSGQIYYFNNSVSQTPSPYKQIEKLPTGATQQSILKTTNGSTPVLVQEFITNELGVYFVPPGAQRFNMHFLKQAQNNQTDCFATIQLADASGTPIGAPLTTNTVLIGWIDSVTPIETYVDVTIPTSYFIDPTDRMIVKIYIKDQGTQNKDVTWFTEGTQNYSYVVTSLGVNNDTVITKTIAEIDQLVANSELIPLATYEITGVDPDLYGGSTIYLQAISNNTLKERGIGKFYNPKYLTHPIWIQYSTNPSDPALGGDVVIWGGKAWINTGNVAGEVSDFGEALDVFTLGGTYYLTGLPVWEAIPYTNSTYYNIAYDEIVYSYPDDRIIYRNEENTNIVITSLENTSISWPDSPIKAFQWGNTYRYNSDLTEYVGIGNQHIDNSYNENINFAISPNSLSQWGITMKNNSAQFLSAASSYTHYNAQTNIIFNNYQRTVSSGSPMTASETGLIFQGDLPDTTSATKMIVTEGGQFKEMTIGSGPQGFQGFQGPQGTNGSIGIDGAQGFQGFQGPQGTNGSIGIDGAQGFQGPMGSFNGDTAIFSSITATNASFTNLNLQTGTGPASPINGDIYFDGAHPYLYSGTAWNQLITKSPNIITVQKSGGDFTSIKDAVNSITDSSPTNGYVINVGPGEFHEDTIDFTGKQYVSIVGSDIQITKVIANTLTQHLFIMDNSVELSFMTIKGVGAGYAAIVCEDLNGFSLIHKLSFYDCDTNILVRANSLLTQFYVEYVDFNGDYSYGIKVESNNGVQALANAENYYNFPGVTGSISNYASGTNSVISVLGSGNTGFGNDKAFYIENGANLTVTSCDITGYEIGIEVGSGGTASTFDIDATSTVDCTYNMYIDHPTTFGTYQGSSSHAKIYVHPDNSSIYWGFLDNEDGEFDVTRKISITHADGSHVDVSTLIFEGSAMGVLDGGDISSVAGLTVSVSSGYGYLKASSGNILRIDWPDTPFAVTDNSAEYIYTNENGFYQSTNLPDIQSNIVFGRVVTQSGSIILIDNSKVDVHHVGDDLTLFNRNALGSIYDSGSIVTGATYSLNVTDGSYYFGSKHYLPTGGNGITFKQYVRNGASWDITDTSTVTSQYDNNTGLTGMSASYFTKHTLYVSGEGTNQEYLLVAGQTQYDNINLVENAALPTPPTYFIDSITPIASVVVRQGTSAIYEIIDIRPVIGFKSSGVNSSSLHANLLGLSSDDHTQYLLVSGSRSMAGDLSMDNNSITGVNEINGVTIESHASRHLPNGLDPLTTGIPSSIGATNQEGIQNAFARQDHIHAGQSFQQVTDIGATTSNTITANSFIKAGGTSSQYLMADGSTRGLLSLGTIGSTANANGATITGTVLNLQPASATFGGVVTTGTQTFAGEKTFSSYIQASSYTYTGGDGGSIFSYGSGSSFYYNNVSGGTHHFGGGPGNVSNNLSVPLGSLSVGTYILGVTASHGLLPTATIAKLGGGVLDIRNTNSSITAGDMTGAIQFTVTDDTSNTISNGYTNATIKVVSTGTPGTGSAGDADIIFSINPGYSMTEQMRLTSSGLLLTNETANTIASFDANKKVRSLSTGTYPSLTELTYVKGVTGSIQTALNAKVNLSGTETISGNKTFSNQTFFGAGDIGTPFQGSLPIITVGGSGATSGGVLDIRNTNTSVVAGNTIGIIQFSVKDDQSVGYTNAQIKVITTSNTGTGSAGGSNLVFYTNDGGSGAAPIEKVRIGSTETPYQGLVPSILVSSTSGGVLDIRNSSTNIVTGNTIGTIQFTGLDDQTVGYTNAQIKVLTTSDTGTGNAGGSDLVFYTNNSGSGGAPTENLRLNGTGMTMAGSVTAASFKKSGGLSTQYLMADGSVSTGGGGGGGTGPQGPQGPQGIVGVTGATGVSITGPQGFQGNEGPIGPSGGPVGPQGPPVNLGLLQAMTYGLQNIF